MSKTKKTVNLSRSSNFWGLLFIMLPFVGIAWFVVVPSINSIYASFTNWSGSALLSEAKWKGFFQYGEVLKDKVFWQSLLNTLIYMLSIPIGIIIAMVLGNCMNKQLPFMNVFRVLYYVPVVASLVAVIMIFQRLFENNGGINQIFAAFGIQPVYWGNKPALAKGVIVFFMVWKGLGHTVILIIAGLQGINQSYYEAAKLDGAGTVKIFTRITMPLLAPMIFYLVITGIINVFQVYTEPSLLFPSRDTQTVVIYLYDAFFGYDNGAKASAVGWLLAILIFMVTSVQFYFNNRKAKA